jgi:RND family efflux transporter MFP subunit
MADALKRVVDGEQGGRNRAGHRFYAAGGFGLVLAVAAVAGLVSVRRTRLRAEEQARSQEVEAGPHVRVVVAKSSPPIRKLTLQGEARPYFSVTLYSKVSGYLKELRVDKGDRVRKNQVLAVIESPEIDQQYRAALADAENRRAVAKRAESLVGPGVISAQDAETSLAAAKTAEAQVAALDAQRAYKVLRAPYDGVVTARYADPGALLQSAQSAQTSALPVVTVAQLHRLRIFAYLEQRDAPLVRVGDAATVRLPELGYEVPSKVARLAGELDARTRMLLVEVDCDDRDERIYPGSFVQVTLEVKAPNLLELPAQALLLRNRNPFVAVVDDQDLVHYRPVVLAEDDGDHIRVASGLKVGERVALSLDDGVLEGGRVRLVSAAVGK